MSQSYCINLEITSSPENSSLYNTGSLQFSQMLQHRCICQGRNLNDISHNPATSLSDSHEYCSSGGVSHRSAEMRKGAVFLAKIMRLGGLSWHEAKISNLSKVEMKTLLMFHQMFKLWQLEISRSEFFCEKIRLKWRKQILNDVLLFVPEMEAFEATDRISLFSRIMNN
jgi:hypothetical protein